jgi:hypothetical protein
MNTTGEPCELTIINKTFDIALYVLVTFETLLSFTPEGYPKSTVQLIMFIFYQSFKGLKKCGKPEDKESPDIEQQPADGQSVMTVKSWKSWISVNVGM